MDALQNIRPRLIEPGVKYFLSASLEQCHILKNKYNNINILNCHIGHTCLSNTTDVQTLDAVTEFYLMTKSEKIFSASNSGFSIMASKYRNIPIFI